jgi:hypothetical protein
MISAGVFLGAPTPNHPLASQPGNESHRYNTRGHNRPYDEWLGWVEQRHRTHVRCRRETHRSQLVMMGFARCPRGAIRCRDPSSTHPTRWSDSGFLHLKPRKRVGPRRRTEARTVLPPQYRSVTVLRGRDRGHSDTLGSRELECRSAPWGEPAYRILSAWHHYPGGYRGRNASDH